MVFFFKVSLKEHPVLGPNVDMFTLGRKLQSKLCQVLFQYKNLQLYSHIKLSFRDTKYSQFTAVNISLCIFCSAYTYLL